MKKTIKMIVENHRAVTNYIQQIQMVFGDTISIKTYTLENPEAYRTQNDTILLTTAASNPIFTEMKKKYFSGKSLITVNLALRQNTLQQLYGYPRGTEALLVNVTKFMAEETIAQLYQAGYSDINFYPYYPGCNAPKLSLAVTPGESQLIPDFVSERIDLGARLIDSITMVELASHLNSEYILKTQRFLNYMNTQCHASGGMEVLLNDNILLEQRLTTLTQIFDHGIIGIDSMDQIFTYNFSAVHTLNVSPTELLHQPAERFFPREALDRCRSQQIPVSLSHNERRERAHLFPVTVNNRYLGAYVIIPDDTSEKISGIPGKKFENGYQAKYRFSDICGHSPKILQTIELAKKMARTESSVLITGESGTGKELFAHSIHNNSSRSDQPFVAINCASLSESLLESELFGYEDGAFTGARKGGRTGLFERANNGTIFLDEIESMSLNIQLKLLRVIQEKEITRVGGERIIPIDVRIISATNQDLLPLMETGAFRQDLFYRLCILPLNIPPLRERKEDLTLLIENFKNQLRMNFILTEESRMILFHYDWPGNIRELRNCIEYMGCQDLPVIEPQNLPITILVRRKPSFEQSNHNLEYDILSLLENQNRGRKQILELLNQKGHHITEGILRKQLEKMKVEGWIHSECGRAGTFITEKGIEILKNWIK